MRKNITGGSGHKGKKNHDNVKVRKLEEISKSEGQTYGQVSTILGDRRFGVRCKKNKEQDYEILTCKLQGKIPRNRRVCKDSYVLVSIPEYNDKSGFIVE